MQLTIRQNFPQVQAALRRLEDDIARKVAARSVNAVVAQAKTAMRKEIRSEFNISAAKINEKLFVRRASFKGGTLGIEAALYSRDPNGKRRSMNVINFAARQTRDGVTLKILKAGGRKTLGSAFIGNKGRTVFQRVPGTKMNSRRQYAGTHAEKIRPVQTIDIQQMFNTRRINRKVLALITAKFPQVFERELAFYTRKFKGA